MSVLLTQCKFFESGIEAACEASGFAGMQRFFVAQLAECAHSGFE